MKNNQNYDGRIFTQSCSNYLKSLGVKAEDGDSINCPYRPDSDSEAFSINGCLYYDHPRGEGGNVWQLALQMQGGDKRKALETLCGSAGVPFVPSSSAERTLNQRQLTEAALEKVKQAFAISADTTPHHVLDYLAKRKVTDKTLKYFGFIPKDRLSTVLTDEEIYATGLGEREDLIILWYFKDERPVYYCTRDVATKAFKKASVQSGVLQHPIWNGDALYIQPSVVWGEGMFDCISLMEMGYGVCGEITCNLIEAHKESLLTALRWRAKNHPDWTFTICLDNDEPTTDGRRRGNEAAEKIALWLWSKGVNVRWVKHDPTSQKVDINLLHQNGLELQIRQMVDGARFVSEILPFDEILFLKNIPRMLARCDYRGAKRVVDLIQDKSPGSSIKDIIEKTHQFPWDWQDIYEDDIQGMRIDGGDVYVFFRKDRFGENHEHYKVFKKTDLISNLRGFQRNPALSLKQTDLDIPFGIPTWKVAKTIDDGEVFNLFAPSTLLLQETDPIPCLPPMWERLLDNLAGKKEKNWLLNHMATYVQTLKKPRTIPVLVGHQGTGKTELARLFGKGIGGFCAVDNGLIEGQFNTYLLNPVVLMDELSNSQKDSNQLKNKIKALINETQTINRKHANTFTAELNNYIIVASNEQVAHVPLVIEQGDRRFTIISGGADKNLAHESWFNHRQLEKELTEFMLFLLSTDISEDKASIPLMNETKQQLMEMGEDFRIAHVRDFIEKRRETCISGSEVKLSHLCDDINEACGGLRLASRNLRPILQAIGLKVWTAHKQLVTWIEPIDSMETTSSSTPPNSPPVQGGMTSDSSTLTIATVKKRGEGSESDVFGADSVENRASDDLWGE